MMTTEEIVKIYDELVASFPEVDRKGKTMPYTSLNGNMFSFVSKEGSVGFRLSSEDREWSMQEHESQPMFQHGREMKEYVEIPLKVLEDQILLKDLFERSWEFAQTLKPKSTKKKK